MKSIYRSIVMLALLACCAAAIAQAPPIRVSELKTKSFEIDGLVIKFPQLGSSTISIQLENSASDPKTFQPERLAIVGSDNKQAYLYIENSLTSKRQIADIMVVPGAIVKIRYDLSLGIKFPARVFYGERQLIEVAKD